MFCPNCGKQIPDDSKFCVGCGSSVAQAPESTPAQTAPQPAYQPVNSYAAQPSYPEADIPATNITVEKKKSKKPLLITLGALLLVAALGVGAWLLFFRGKSETKRNQNPISPLLEAAEGSLDELRNFVKDLPNLTKVVDNCKDLTKTSTIHMGMINTYRLVYDGGSSEGGMDMSVDCDLKEGRLKLNLDLGMFTNGGGSIPFSLYYDKDQVQVACDSLLNGQTYCLPTQDFGRNWNKSALAELTNVTLPDDFQVPDLSAENLKKQMDKVYGKDWTDFYDSIKPKKVSGADSRFDGFGTAYRIDWNQKLLDKMADQAEEELDAVKDVETPQDLEGVEFDRLLPSLVIKGLSEIEDLDRFQYCVNRDGNLIGLYIPDGSSSGTEIRLAGKENIWQRIEVGEVRDGETEWDPKSVEVLISDGTLTLQGENGSVVYRDSDGSITNPAAEPEEENMTMRLKPADGGLSAEMIREEVDEDWGYRATQEISIVVSSVLREIRPAGNAKNLLEMNRSELEELLESISYKIDELFNQYGEWEQEPDSWED